MELKKLAMLNRMNEMGYVQSFKETLLNAWDLAESTGKPSLYYADVGSLVINGLHIHNGVGDGVFKIDVAYNTDEDFEAKKVEYKDTELFFYSDYLSICLYDLLPESAFEYHFGDIKWGEIRRNRSGNFLILIHH